MRKAGVRGPKLATATVATPLPGGLSVGVSVGLAIALALGLAACAPERDTVPMPVPTSSSSASPSPGAEVSEPEPDPTLLPDGTVLANRDYFDFVNARLLDKNGNPGGEAIINNLVDAGFDKSKMEVTPDFTEVFRLPADSIEFSVRLHDECLIGQTAGGKYYSMIGPTLSDGSCLAGDTRDIDW